MQLDALQAAGAKRVFKDVGSGSLRSRPQLDACLGRLGDGDTLIVWRLDRLGRSLRHLLTVLAALGERGVAFQSLTEAIDTTTAAGRLQVHLFAALAEFERSLGQERTRAGLAKRHCRQEPQSTDCGGARRFSIESALSAGRDACAPEATCRVRPSRGDTPALPWSQYHA